MGLREGFAALTLPNSLASEFSRRRIGCSQRPVAFAHPTYGNDTSPSSSQSNRRGAAAIRATPTLFHAFSKATAQAFWSLVGVAGRGGGRSGDTRSNCGAPLAIHSRCRGSGFTAGVGRQSAVERLPANVLSSPRLRRRWSDVSPRRQSDIAAIPHHSETDHRRKLSRPADASHSTGSSRRHACDGHARCWFRGIGAAVDFHAVGNLDRRDHRRWRTSGRSRQDSPARNH